MPRHLVDAVANVGVQLFELIQKPIERHGLGERIVMLGLETLPEVDREPARRREQAVLILLDHARMAEQAHLALEGVRDLHRSAVAPQLRVFAAVEMIVKDQEVADALIFEVHPQIELVDEALVVPHATEAAAAGA